MIVVADASPLICLTRIGRLDLLRELFTTVMIPDAVRDEVAARPEGDEVLRTSPWIHVRTVTVSTAFTDLERQLDQGEAAAIALAMELGAEVLLIDEHRGRRMAEERGLIVLGVVGVVLRAHRVHLIDSVGPVLQALVAADFRLSRDVIAEALLLAGEA